MFSQRQYLMLLGVFLGVMLCGCIPNRGKIAARRPAGDPSATGLTQIGLMFESQGETEKAIESYERALARDPSCSMLTDRIARLRSQPEGKGPAKTPEEMTVAGILHDYDQRRSAAEQIQNLNWSRDHANHRTVAYRTAPRPLDDSILIGRQSALVSD